MKRKISQEHLKVLRNWDSGSNAMTKLFLIVSLLIFSLSGQTQNLPQSNAEPLSVIYEESNTVTPLPFDEEVLKKYEGDPHFDYTEVTAEESWWHQFKSWLSGLWSKFWTWLFGDYESNSFLIFLFKALPYVILGGILVFIIWLFYRINPGSKLLLSKEPPEVYYTDEEEIIKSKNIHELIDQALLNKDFRLAVRYGFLLLLKRLSETEIIAYEFDKTNSDYQKEIKSDSILPLFKKVSTLYEYTWYGNFLVSETDYVKASKQFTALHSKIKQHLE